MNCEQITIESYQCNISFNRKILNNKVFPISINWPYGSWILSKVYFLFLLEKVGDNSFYLMWICKEKSSRKTEKVKEHKAAKSFLFGNHNSNILNTKHILRDLEKLIWADRVLTTKVIQHSACTALICCLFTISLLQSIITL